MARWITRSTNWVSPGPHTTCGLMAVTRKSGAVGGQSGQLCCRLGTRVINPCAQIGICYPGSAGAPEIAAPKCATDGEETNTKSRTPALCAASSRVVVPVMLVATKSCQGNR